MEAVAVQSLSFVKLSRPPSNCSTSASYVQCKAVQQAAENFGCKSLKLSSISIQSCQQRNSGVVHASGGTSAPANVVRGWRLEPVGNGDWKHIGFKVDMPGAYEIFSTEMIIGRVPDKADLVIPVATVSGIHAKIENKGGSLFITDLDSTNGTFINEQRVSPGFTAPVPPGSLLTFGDTNLAIFRVSKIEKAVEAEIEEKPEEVREAVPAPQQEPTS